MFKSKKLRENRIRRLDREISRLEKARANCDPADPKYEVLTKNLNELYAEKESHLTPWRKKPEAKALVASALLTGITVVAVANSEQLHPITSKMFPSCIANLFRGRRA